VSTGSQILIIDSRTPPNSVVTYQAIVDGVSYAAAPVTVTAEAPSYLQTIDGLLIVPIEIASVTEPRKRRTRVAAIDIAGREDPATRLDVPALPSYSWQLETESIDSAQMLRILESGSAVVRRVTTGLRDLDPVVLGVVVDWSDELITEGYDTWRRWTLVVQGIGEPQPSTALIAYTWDDFDAAMAARVWSYYSEFESLAGWASTGGTLSQQSTGGYSSPKFARVTASTAGTLARLLESGYAGNPSAPNAVVTVTARVKGTPGRTGAAVLRWSGGSVVVGASVTLTGAWQRVSVTATAPAGTTGVAAGAQLNATGVAVNDVIDVDAVTVSPGAVVPVGTFDEMFATWDEFDAADWASLM